MLSPGTRLGDRYTVEDAVGLGGLAEVYRGRDTHTGHVVKLKLTMGAGPQNRKPALAVAGLGGHPNIVSTLDILEHEGRLCVIEEWIDGASLESLLHGGCLSLAETMRVAEDLASALEHAHARGILHRDIKPSNIVRSSEGHYTLVDFDAFGQLDPATGATATGEMVGTPLYMSPEQATSAPQTPGSDLFGVGLVLFRCLHGYVPGEDATDVVELFRDRVSTPIEIPPSPLRRVIAGCVALEPADRLESAADVRRLVRWIRDDLAGLAVGPIAGPQLVTPDLAHPAFTAPSAARRGGGLAAAAVIAVFAVVFLVVLVVVVVVVNQASGTADLIDGTPTLPSTETWGPILRVALGGGVAILAVRLARTLRRRWSARSPETERQAASILLGAGDRGDLTKSLVIQVDHLVTRLQTLDKKIIGMTVLAMVREYEDSKASSDRQAALLNVVTLMEKLQAHLAPWHVRHRDAIASGVAIVGCLTGVASAVSAFVA